jgi:mRNA interferase HigB
VKVVGRSVLAAFCRRHTDAISWIEHWISEAEEAKWLTPQEIKNRYASASFLPGNTVIFNVKGNEYRMQVRVAYKTGVVAVQWLGTHSEYDRRG